MCSCHSVVRLVLRVKTVYPDFPRTTGLFVVTVTSIRMMTSLYCVSIICGKPVNHERADATDELNAGI